MQPNNGSLPPFSPSFPSLSGSKPELQSVTLKMMTSTASSSSSSSYESAPASAEIALAAFNERKKRLEALLMRVDTSIVPAQLARFEVFQGFLASTLPTNRPEFTDIFTWALLQTRQRTDSLVSITGVAPDSDPPTIQLECFEPFYPLVASQVLSQGNTKKLPKSVDRWLTAAPTLGALSVTPCRTRDGSVRIITIELPIQLTVHPLFRQLTANNSFYLNPEVNRKLRQILRIFYNVLMQLASTEYCRLADKSASKLRIPTRGLRNINQCIQTTYNLWTDFLSHLNQTGGPAHFLLAELLRRPAFRSIAPAPVAAPVMTPQISVESISKEEETEISMPLADAFKLGDFSSKDVALESLLVPAGYPESHTKRARRD